MPDATGGGGGREERVDLAVRLLGLAEEALAAESAEGPAAGERPAGADVERALAALTEAEDVLCALRGSATGPEELRRLSEVSLWAAEIRYAYGRGAHDLDAVIDLLDTLLAWAAEDEAASAAAGDPEPPARRERVELSCELALNLTTRWSLSEPGEPRSGDADRIAGLLGGVLTEPDSPLVPDPTRCRAALGLVLSDRSRGPDHFTPERLADRRTALGLLRTARHADDLDPDLVPPVTFDLVQLSAIELYDRVQDDPSPAVRDRAAAEVVALLDLLRDLLTDDGPAGADAAELGADLCDLLVDLATTSHAQGTAVDWYRGALAHPALRPGTALDVKGRLAFVLCLRSEENRAARRPGDPAPAKDRAAAATLFEEVLAPRPEVTGAAFAEDGTTGSDPAAPDDEFVANLSGLVQVLWLDQSEGLLTDQGVDRLASRARQLTRLIGPDDTDRAELVLKAAITLAQRAVARGLPLSYDLGNIALVTGGPDPNLSLEHTTPQVVSDLREAIALLRTGVGLYHHEDELHLYAHGMLGLALLLDFACRLPTVEHTVLREALRFLRVALERLPEQSGMRDEDFQGAFLSALMYQVWFAEPFTGAGPGQASLPDVAGFPSVEDDLQLLSSMLGSSSAVREEPVFVHLSVMVEVLRSPGDLPSTEDCRVWANQLRQAAERVVHEAWGLRVAMLGVAGALGLRVVQAGSATAAERAATTDALRQARDQLPPGAPLRDMLDGALRQNAAGDVRELIRWLLRAPGTAGDAPRPGTATPSPQGPGAAEPGASGVPPTPAGARAEAPVLDLAAAVLLGDGSPDPFALPSARVTELVGTAQPLSAEAAATLALLHHRQWLRARDGQDLDSAVVLIRQALTALEARDAAGSGPRPALADRCAEFLARLLLDRHLMLGDHTDLDAAVRAYGSLLERTPEHAVVPPLGDLLAAAGDPRVPARLFRPGAQGRGAPFRAELLAAAGTALLVRARSGRGLPDAAGADAPAMLSAALRALPPQHPRVPALRTELAWCELEQARDKGDAVALRGAVDALMGIARECPAAGSHRTGVLLRSAAALCLLVRTDGHPPGQGAEGLPPARPEAGPGDLLDQGIDLLREAAEGGPHEFHGSRSRCLYGLGILLLTRHLRTGDRADLRRSVAVLGEAWVVLNATPGDPFAVVLIRALSQAHRAHGPGDREHRRESLATARSALTTHGRAVLLQSGAGHGLKAARTVAADMLRLVRWSLADELPESAFEALELGRGLVLNSATVSVTVPELLREGGHLDLARRWEVSSSGDDHRSVPDGLRRRVLEALAGSAAEKRLVSAPHPGQVGQALRRLGNDALAYLVPGEATEPGHAVVVTATGAVHALRLPGLTVPSTGPLAAYVRALRAFQEAGREENRPAPHHPQVMHELHRRKLLRLEDEWHEALDSLCSWAGEAAMGPLLSAAARWWPGRTPCLVLAPVGALGIVPWHAARCPEPSDRAVYACERAVVSSCATARQLVEVADRPRAPVGAGSVAVVADPGGSPTMHREAALVGSLYPEATVIGGLGRYPDSDDIAPSSPPLPAEPGSLEPFLPGRGAVPTALLHINCHADSAPSPTDSVLLLDAARGVTMTVTDVLAGAAGRDPRMPGGTVVLANCTSDLTLSDHDEALTLSTAFLSAGATAVVGSRWAVADDPRTTLLMLVLHHHLKRGEPARDALRAAQLWMLDPDRTLPPELARHEHLTRNADERRLDELEVWAAFAHHGQ
ncbi:CHAT domain-containing protein [Streptomyces sp. NPDC058964]|uniref:CHAT domain-containing protein n=1 Tax=Streptomyces sp. NPDC058964 TaxID=3346681 RepID=UPI0036BE5857